jgi:hypothetical protein
VILASSEHAFPFHLTNEEIGFNLDDFTAFLYGACCNESVRTSW